MAGETVEVFVRGSNDWVVGAEVTKATGTGIRYFDDPTRDGMSIGHVKDFHRDMDVHLSSGIMNKAFYVVSQSLGVRDAFRSFVLANRMYWREKCTFEEAACNVIKASYDTGYPMEEFEAAFRIVGLQLSQCTDFNQFILTLNANETRSQLSVSKTVQPMFIVRPPSSAQNIEVHIPESTKAKIFLTKSYLRNKDSSIIERNSSGTLRHSFNDIGEDFVYLRIVGGDDNIQIISLQVRFF